MAYNHLPDDPAETLGRKDENPPCLCRKVRNLWAGLSLVIYRKAHAFGSVMILVMICAFSSRWRGD